MAEKFFWKDGRRRELLPIDGRLTETLSTLHDRQVIVVEAETGAGKTTRIPQAFLLEYPDLQIWMTQTRRNAVRWNGKRIAQEMGSAPGGVVGWRLFGDDPVVSRDTRLTLGIDQSFTNRIREMGKLPNGLLIIDEAHERSVSTDLLLGLVKELLPNFPETKVLITSATIDTKKFSEFFDGAPVLSIQGRCYPVSTEVVRLTRYEHHSQGAARAATLVLERFAKDGLRVPTESGSGTQIVPQGTVLVLLPGKEDIASVMSSIQREASRLKLEDRVEVIPCHGESSPEEQDAVQEALRPGTLRFACGTEVLRSSVTVRETVGTIDSLQVKRLVTDAKGVAHLDKIAISMAEAEQGKGRAGRTQPGFYMPVSFESEYENLQPYPTPAILREPITSVVLQVADVGRNVRNFAFIDAPALEKVEVAITRLKRLGALDEQEKITKVGEMLAQFPVDPERAKTLVTAHQLGVLPEVAVVTAVLETEGIFFSPNREKEKCLVEEPILRRILSCVGKDRWGRWEKIDKPRDTASVDLSDLPEWVKKKGQYWEVDTDEYGFPKPEGARWVADLTRCYFATGSKSDFAAIVRTYRAFKAKEQQLREEQREERENGEHRSREQQLRDWCERWFVNYKRIRMAEDVMHQIREELVMSPLRLENGLAVEREFDAAMLTKSLASGLIDHVLVKAEDRTGRLFKGPLGNINLAYQSACPAGIAAVIVGGARKIPVQGRRGSTSHILLADLAAPVKAEWLPEVMPQLCSATRKGDHHYDAERDMVVETEEILFVDVTVPRTVPSVDPEKCAWAFARAGFQGYLLSEFGEVNRKNTQILQEVESWRVRSGGEVKQVSQDDVIAHYATVLYMHTVASLATFRAAVENGKLRKEELILVLEDFVSKEKQEEILRGNPDRIVFLGAERQVQYPKGSNPPQVMLGENAEETDTWKHLDSQGTEVRLPGGRLANVVVPARGWSFSESNLSILKEKVRQQLNDYVWYSIDEAAKPQITVPYSGGENFPAIIEFMIGTDSLTGEPLYRFGAIIRSHDYHRQSEYKGEWLGVREKAEKVHAETRATFEEQKRQERERIEKDEVIQEARAMQERTGEVLSCDGIYDIKSALRNNLSDRRYDSFPSTASEIREWIRTTEALVAEVEQALIAARKRKEEEEQKQQREEERRTAEKAKRRAKEEKFSETGVLVDEAPTNFNTFAAALASAKRKQKR